MRACCPRRMAGCLISLGRFQPRRGVPVERHDVRRARAEWRLDRARPTGADDLRCHVGGVRDAPGVGQARCRHLVLAEGAGRRGCAWHAGAVAACGGTAGQLQACVAVAEDLSPDVWRQADRGDFQRRDDQHAVDAVCRGCAGRAALGGIGWRARRADCAVGGQPCRHRALGGADRLGRFPCRGCCDAVLHLDLPEVGGALVHGVACGQQARRRSGLRHCWRRKAWPTTSGRIAMLRRDCASGAAQQSRPRISRRCCRGWIGRTTLWRRSTLRRRQRNSGGPSPNPLPQGEGEDS